MRLLNYLPVFLYYSGQTKFCPIHVSDMTEIIFQIVKKKIYSQKIECIGPEVISFKEIMQKLLGSIKKKKIINTNSSNYRKYNSKFNGDIYAKSFNYKRST